MLDKIQYYWNKIQDLLDISGDSIMAILTSALIFRIIYAALGHAPITTAEAMAYGSAIASFGYSNVNKK